MTIENRKKVNIKAIVSLVFGILSLGFIIIPLLGITCAILGLLFGYLSLNETKRLGQKGKNIAVAGLTSSGFGVFFALTFHKWIYRSLKQEGNIK